MKLAWLTDIHLNFVEFDNRKRFYSSIRETQADAILISGDVAEAATLIEELNEIERHVDLPIYFVLGNHDFYRSSISNVHARLRIMPLRNLTWLTDAPVRLLTSQTALIGDDGWADGRLGDYLNSRVMLNDYVLINEFAGLNAGARLKLMQELADAAATRLSAKLLEACAQRKRVILVTHVPPFPEACWYDGKRSDKEWLPHFSCKAIGDSIVEVMDQHPDCELLVLCGHTHGAGFVQIRPNVAVKTGGAVYGQPVIQEIIDA